MPSLTIKNIPDDLHEALRESATRHRRSLNNEVIVCLEKTLRSRRIEPHEFLERIHRLQQLIKLPPLTDRFLEEAKNERR